MKIADLARVARNRGTLLRRDRWSRQRLLAHQARALAALRTFAYARSPFYQKFHAGLMHRPLIRYELSDKVRLAATPCPCGRPFRAIDSVQGRVEETLHFPAAAAGRVAIDPVVFESVLDTVPATQWQVIQEPASLDILLAGLAADYRDEAIAEPLRRELSSRGAVAPEIRVRRVSAIPRGATGKAPLIRCQLGSFNVAR